MRFSASLMTMERRSVPIRILSLARSNSSMPTMRLLARAANSAASLTRLASSAPEKPGVPADGVDLVDEDDAGGVLLRLLEHVAHARGADAHEHLHEVRAGDGEERHLGLAGNGARQQRLAGSRRAHHQHALRDLAAELLELARVLEEVDDFGDFLLRFLDPRDIREGHVHLILAQEARAALAEGHGAAAAGCAL